MRIFARPLFASLFFVSVVLLYYGIGWLNYARAGKLILTGAPTIGLLLTLLHRRRLPRWLTFLYLFVVIILFANLAFQAGLRDIFSVEQDEMMIMKSLFGTDRQESYEFILQYKPYLIKHLLLFLLLSSSFLLITMRHIKQSTLAVSRRILLVWILLLIVGHLDRSIRKSDPFVFFPYFYTEYQGELKELRELAHLLDTHLDIHALSDTKYIGKCTHNTLVWVIGESSTKYNWSLYGYERDTTPMINSMKENLLVFQNITAAGPITIPAFERMMTQASKKYPDLWKKTPSIVQLAKQAGYHTYWISNHTTDAHSGITYIFAHQADEATMTNKGKARGEGSYDESVLPAYKKALQDPYEKKLIIVHLLGSHPAYDFRYPPSYSKYTTVYDDTVARKLSTDGRAKWAITFRNLYDNSVRYGDHIRYTLLSLLQHSPEADHATWLYHPDHGEDVCHHNNFSGHNPKAKEQWEIPMIFWQKELPKTDTSIPYDLENIESSILGLLKIHTPYYHSKKDIFLHH